MSETERASKKQRELLLFVDGFIKGNGFGPSYREVMRALGYKSVSTVAVHIDGLIAKGYLIKRTHSARSLEVVTTDTTASPAVQALSDHQHWLIESFNKQCDAYITTQKTEQLADTEHLLETVRILCPADAYTAARQRYESLAS